MGIKEENEITVRIIGNIKEVYKILEDKGFEITEESTYTDIFMIPDYIINKMSDMESRDILKHAILIRNLENKTNNTTNKRITFKEKQFNNKGEIISQKATNCNIYDIDEAITFFEAIKYSKIMEITERDTIYEKNGLEVAIKDVQNGDNLIEIETISSDNKFDTIEKLKEKIINLEIPIDNNNFFVKKAEIELDKILGKKTS